jgi:hypothetical protein
MIMIAQMFRDAIAVGVFFLAWLVFPRTLSALASLAYLFETKQLTAAEAESSLVIIFLFVSFIIDFWQIIQSAEQTKTKGSAE